MPTKKVAVIKEQHFMGKECGYDLLPDGRIRVAPKYSDKFNELELTDQSIKAILNEAIKSCQSLLWIVKKERQKVWKDIVEDYTLETDKYNYIYVERI